MRDNTLNKGIKFQIKKKNKIVTEFNAVLLDNDIIITEVSNVTEDAPQIIKSLYECSNLFQNSDSFDHQIALSVYKFIKGRSLSNDRKDLDELLTEAYGLRKDINNYRLYNCQYTLSILNGCISPYDEYYVVPEKDEIISFVNINPKFWNVWLLEHNVSYETFLRKNNGIHKYCIPTSEYSEFIYDLHTRKRYIKILNEFETKLIEVETSTQFPSSM